jgi:hypothetical protein
MVERFFGIQVLPSQEGEDVSDAKQPIYDAMNWLGATIPGRQPDDSTLIIQAYQKIVSLDDRESQKLFSNLIVELQRSNEVIGRISNAWHKSADRLRDSCVMIDQAIKKATGE